MKVKIFKLIKVLIIPMIVVFIIAMLDYYLNFYPGYLTITVVYCFINYLMIRGVIFLSKSNNDKESLYVWLDSLEGSDDLLKTLFLNEKTSNIINDLDRVFNKLVSLTKHDKKKMKLLRGYFKAVDEEGPNDLLNKTILGIFVAILIWIISRGTLWGLATFSGDSGDFNIKPVFITILNYITYIIEFLLFLAIFIRDYFRSKKRNRIIIEVLDVCINEKD